MNPGGRTSELHFEFHRGSTLTDLQSGYELTESYQEEVEVEEELELLVKYDRKKCHYRVLLVAESIWGEGVDESFRRSC